MPYRRKDGAVWWASFTDPSGQRVRRSTGTTDRKEAAALEAKWKLEAFRVRQWGDKPSRSFEELMLDYLEATEADKRSADKDLMRTENLKMYFTGKIMNELTGQDIRAFVVMRREQGRSNATINRDLALLSTAINYANREWDWDIPNPVRGRKLKESEGRTRHLSREEFDRLIDVAGKEPHARHLPDFITLAVHTGCRANELLGLEWSRVDLSSGLIFLEGRHTKAGKRRSVPLNQSARRAVLSRARFKAKHCPETRWVFCTRKGRRIESVRKSFATARERAGVEDFRIHDLRHTCAAWLVSSGVPLTEVRDLLGHSTVMMTERYAHLAPENIREAVKRLDTVSRSGHGQELEQQTA